MFLEVINALNEGFVKTLELFALTLVGALPLGLVISFGSMSRFKILRAVTKTVVWIIRGTPLMLQLLIIFYVPGMVLPQNPWNFFGSYSRMVAVVVAFIINYACYFSEIFRGGIESISKGQYEAGQVLGMTKSQVFFKVVLMQVVKRVIPPMSNEIITLVKDTSLARIISVYEIIWAGQSFIRSEGIFWPFFFTALYYLAFNGVLTLLFGYIEKKLDYYRS